MGDPSRERIKSVRSYPSNRDGALGFYGGKPGIARQRINCRALQAHCIAPPRPHRKSVYFSSMEFTKANWHAAPGPLLPPPPHPQAQHPPHPVQHVTLGQLAPGIVLGYPHPPWPSESGGTDTVSPLTCQPDPPVPVRPAAPSAAGGAGRLCSCSPRCLDRCPTSWHSSPAPLFRLQLHKCNFPTGPIQLLRGRASCRNANFSYGQCNPTMEQGLTKSGNRQTPVEGRFPPSSATEWPSLNCCHQSPSTVHPADVPEEVSGVGPGKTPHKCDPLREVM